MTATLGTVASVAARAGGTVVRQVRSAVDPSAARPAGAGGPASGWLVVTVLRDAADLQSMVDAGAAGAAGGARRAHRGAGAPRPR